MHVKRTAPGGERWEKVGLPFDPDLFDHMVEHGVAIKVGGAMWTCLGLPLWPCMECEVTRCSFVLPLC